MIIRILFISEFIKKIIFLSKYLSIFIYVVFLNNKMEICFNIWFICIYGALIIILNLKNSLYLLCSLRTGWLS